MSVRAYRIIEIIEETEPTFNFWHDDWLVNKLVINGLNDDGVGLAEISYENVLEVEKALQLEKDISIEDREYYKGVLSKLKSDCEKTGYAQYNFY